MTQRPSADRRAAIRSPAAWLAAVMLAIMMAGLGAWLFLGRLPVEPPPPAVVVVEPPTQPLPAGPRVIDARLSQILAVRHIGTTIYRPSENRRVLVIDYPSLTEQAHAMNRLAALIEKDGAPRDRLLSDAEMAALTNNAATFYFAHDYAATSLARFFSMAESESEALNAQEKDLLALLLAAHVLDRGPAGGYLPGTPEMAVISLVQPQADDPGTPEDETVDPALRDTMLRHEMSHGEFFTNEAYRKHCERFWRERLTESERKRFRDYLSRQGYDAQDETLMINEAQAYLMHTPDPRAFSADALRVTNEQLVDMQRRFMDPQPPTPLLGAALPAGG